MGACHGKVIIVKTGDEENMQGDMHAERDAYKKCYGCRRMTTDVTSMGDWRNYCQECYEGALMNGNDLKPVIKNVRKFFADNNLSLKGRDPVYPVLSDEIKKFLARNGKECSTIPVCKGISTNKTGCIQVVTRCKKKHDQLEIMTTKKDLSSDLKKSAILMCYGFSWIQAGRILAHEFLHTWFFQKGLRRFRNQEIQEGCCELMAYRWILQQNIAENDKYNRILRDTVNHEMESRRDLYGSGFRKAKIAFENWDNDLGGFINAVSSCEDFPSKK